MPIRPENKERYPKDWPEIRARILERAGHKCEVCGLKNYLMGYRLKDGSFLSLADCREYKAEYGKLTKIVLTIAHWDDPDPANCADDNLKATCQRCHLRHDAELHAQNAKRTRADKKLGGLFALMK